MSSGQYMVVLCVKILNSFIMIVSHSQWLRMQLALHWPIVIFMKISLKKSCL